MSKFCTNCGAQLSDDSVFCENCGARLQGAPAAPQPGQQAYPQPAAQPVYYQPQTQQYQQPTQQYQQPTQQYQQPTQQYQQPAQQYQQPTQQYQQPTQQYQQPTQQYQQPAAAPQKEQKKKSGPPRAVLGIVGAVIVAAGVYIAKSVLDKNDPYVPGSPPDSPYVTVEEQPRGGASKGESGGSAQPSAGGGTTVPFPETDNGDSEPDSSGSSAPLPEAPAEPPADWWSASWGPLFVAYPKNYEEDAYDGEFYATHPGYPDVIDMLMLKHGTYTPGSEQSIMANYQQDYDSIYDETFSEGNGYSMYSFKGEQYIDDDNTYYVTQYTIFRAPDAFTVAVLTDRRDNQLGDPIQWMAFLPDVPWIDG